MPRTHAAYFLVLVIASLAIPGIARAEEAQNFLSNGSFETLGDDGFPVCWRLSRQPDKYTRSGHEGLRRHRDQA